MDRWTHFEYTSGANPYIAMTYEERDKVLRKWKRRGVLFEEVNLSPDIDTKHYLVHDKE